MGNKLSIGDHSFISRNAWETRRMCGIWKHVPWKRWQPRTDRRGIKKLTLIRLLKKTYLFGFAGSVQTPQVFFKEIVILNHSNIYFVVLGTGNNYLKNLCRIMPCCEMSTVSICLGSARTPQKRMRVNESKPNTHFILFSFCKNLIYDLGRGASGRNFAISFFSWPTG